MLFNTIHFLLLAGFINSHSWIDCTDRRSDGGCAGYIRNFQGHYDTASTYKILDRNPSASLCDPRTQLDYKNYPSQYPMAKVYSGQTLYIDYFENGHVNLDKLPPNNKPHPGHYGIYWTGIPINQNITNPADDPGQMVDRGDLDGAIALTLANFDDGECADITYYGRKGPTPCLGTYTIPQGTQPGIYQVAWVWHFNRDQQGLGEEYVSCWDVQVIDQNTYNSEHANIKWQPYQPLGPTVVDIQRIVHTDGCEEDPTWDSTLYNCRDGSLCQKPDLICGLGQCYNPETHRCCNDDTVLPLSQECEHLANPYERIKTFSLKPYTP